MKTTAVEKAFKSGLGMGKSWVKFCVAGLMISLSAARGAETPVELKNPGFEESVPDNESLPTGWEVDFSTFNEGDGTGTTGVVKRDVSEAHTGQASAYLKSEGPRYARFRQGKKILPGTTYRLSCWVLFHSASAGTNVSISIRGRLTDKTPWSVSERSTSSGAGDWIQIVSEFPVPENATQEVLIELRVIFANGTVEAWFDDIELVEITQ